MARLPYLDKSDLPTDQQDLLARNINLYRMLVHSPGGARAFSGLGQYIRHGSKLDPRLRELAILQVGYLARAPYEWSHHIKIGFDFGVTEADIRNLIEESGGHTTELDPVARLVLQLAREMTQDLSVRDATFEALRSHFGHECLIDLVMTIAFYNGVVRVLAALVIDVEDSYQTYLDQFPLPD